ncbi:M28 family peptidase, partial [candidate division WOR-3 bacterium]|nr:M28 family peptidase [candidate division WOR-3 bacterium]
DQQAPRFTYNPLVQVIVDQVDADSVLSYVQRLQDFVTRYSTHDSCTAAANYIASKFTDYGCDSVYFQYHTSGHAPNVIGVKRGTLYPDSIYTVVCGHLDATSYQSPNIAPGADDNASGTASVIEALRVMRNYQFEYSVRYIAFTGEEFGLYGSYHYASLAHSQGDSILGVLNADMIGYANAYPESVDVLAKISNPACEPFADFFIAAADSYTTLLTNKQMVNSTAYSDHHPFWQNGYLALCNIEDNPPVNPYYHEPGDTIGAGYNDNDFCTEVTKAQVAALCLMANPLATAYLTIPNYWIVDSAPGGNGNGLWENGEEVDLVVQVHNIGIDTAKNTYGLLNTSSGYITFIDDSCHIGNIVSQDTVEMSFRMSAAGSVPLGYLANFDLALGCDAGTWDYSLQIYINPLPSLAFHEYSIVDANGILEPGETADLVVALINQGAAPAINATSILSCTSPLITINDNSGNFGQISIGDTVDNMGDPFNVTASGSAPYGTLVDCELIIQAGIYIDTLDFLLAIGEPVPYDTGYYYVYYSGGLHDYAPTFDWFGIAPPGPGTIISEITDEDADTVTVTLPFDFPYYGTTYNSIGICSNGFLEMGFSTHRFGSNTEIPSVGGPRAMIAAFWDDLDPSLYGDIYQYYDAANHRWIVEFYDVAHYG